MKRIFSVILVALMMMSMIITSFAAELTTDGGSQNVTVTYGMSEGFTVTIPGDFTISTETNKGTATVSASNVMIAHGKVLEVAVSGDDYVGEWELIDTTEPTNVLIYTIGTSEGAADISDDSVVLSVASGTAYNDTIEQTMYFTVTDTLSKAGTYQDTLTFTVSVNRDDMITFNVGGRTFYANEGDTWLDFITSDANTTFTCDPPIDDGPHEVYLFQMYSNFIVANFLVDSCPEHAEAFGLENIPFIVDEEDGALLGINDEIIDGAYYVLEGAA